MFAQIKVVTLIPMITSTVTDLSSEFVKVEGPRFIIVDRSYV